ncbi:Type I Iterative PKS [Alternaria novae-zelandiae]|uniref:Type I Iterative PKS n=1 Tax=Alternaria novae-zelandiae TaxID=430562 RepID=UPI0020C53BB3|nr:Type I Iterative PKS [Alternaria novae-zelandiae]KAI4671141.1 Type I Iterative PKS [Alternaria novae-zelandiae]
MARSEDPEPMAIVGMGCRWAGGVRNPTDLWELLLNKRSGYQDWAAPRFSAEGFYHPNPERPGTTAAKGGYVVTEDPRLFDPSFFGISGLEAETIDPSQRKLLEVVYESLESAGETWESVNGTRTGVYVADISYDNSYAQTRDWEYARPHATTGVCHNILSNRINYVFNLRGPSVTLDSACTSAMYGLHMAIQAIRDGDCDSAIVATANYIMDPSMQIAMDKLGALSGTSMSHAFDAAADGYARGEGFAAIYVKKPQQAMQHGNPIRALVRGSAIGANGRSSGITHPSGTAQEDIIRKAYHNAGKLSPSETPFLECHGTGTRVGDPLEVEAAGKVFGPGRSSSEEDRLLIGSVKTNLGHTEGAAALASIFKVVLALEAGVIPPSIGVTTLNPRIDFDKAKARVVTEVMPWPEDKLRRASVTSAGFGGSIGHCILDHVEVVYPDYVKPGIVNRIRPVNGHANGHANGSTHSHGNGLAVSQLSTPQPPTKIRKADVSTRELVLLPFAAHSDTSLNANIDALARVIDKHSLGDVAYTLAARRSKLAQRTFRIFSKHDVAQGLVKNVEKTFSSPPDESRLAFVFTGQGAQWHAMGAQLFDYNVFRTSVDYLDRVLESLPGAPSWNIAEILSGNCEPDRVQMPDVSQTVCTAVQIGLVDLLASWSVSPAGVVGHSSGEMAAAYAAGRITAAEAIAASFFRGQAVAQNKKKGVMLAVSLDREQANEYLEGLEQYIKIAAVNSPGSLTLSGDEEAVKRLATTLTHDGVFNRLLKTGGNAYHSHHMIALGHAYETLLTDGMAYLEKSGLKDQRPKYPHIPWSSSVTPWKSLAGANLPVSYWRANLESPVQFSDAVASLAGQEELDVKAFVEIGPHPALRSPLDQILKSIGKPLPYAYALKRGEDNARSLLQLAGSLFGLNAKIDLAAVNAVDAGVGALEHGTTAIDLPPYQFTYGPVAYYESRASKEYRLRTIPRHDLIGSRVAGNAKLRPQYRNVLRLKDLPWLSDHRLLPNVVFPAAGYMCMAMVAATQLYQATEDAQPILGHSLRNVNIKSALNIPEDQYGIEIMLSLVLDDKATAQEPAWVGFSVSSVTRETEQWTEHCTGMVKVDISEHSQVETMSVASESRTVNARSWYKKFAAIGLGYGPAFQALSEIRADPTKNHAAARLNLQTTAGMIRGGESEYAIHPASLDAMIQLGLLASHGGQTDKTTTAFVPIHLSELRVKSNIDQASGTAVAYGEFKGLRSAYLQLQLQDEAGDILVDIEDLRCVSYSLEATSPDKTGARGFSSPFTRMVYKPDFGSLRNEQARLLFPAPSENVAQGPVLAQLDSMASLIAIDVTETLLNDTDSMEIDGLGTTERYIAKLRQLAKRGQAEQSTELSAEDRKRRLREAYEGHGHLVEVRCMQRLHAHMVDIMDRRRSGEAVLAEGGLLTDFFEKSLFVTGVHTHLSTVFDSMAHVNPSLRILELKGGKGQTARLVLETLNSGNSIKRYRDYTVTDTSENALQAARSQLSNYGDVHFSVLDMEQDTLPAGFEAAYDVVFASQAVHTAASVAKALQTARKLLKTGGKLVLAEVTGSSAWVDMIGGAQKGYWHGVNDGRMQRPFLDVAGWDATLRSVGFRGAEIVLDDYPAPWTQSSVVVAGVVDMAEKAVDAARVAIQPVHLLHSTAQPPPLLAQLARVLECRGESTKTVRLDSSVRELPVDARVVAFLDDDHLLLAADERQLELFQHLTHHTSSMLWLTSTGMAVGRSPDGAIAGGLLRTISTEAPTGRFCSVDIDADHFILDDLQQSDELLRVLVDCEQALQRPINSETSEDREFAWHGGCLWVSRLLPEPALSAYAEPLVTPATHGAELLPLDTQGPVRAAFETPGILSSLYFRPYTELRKQPLSCDYIEVKVTAVGLNWKDLVLATGRFDGNNLSSEYAGIVTQVGTDAASSFAVGDPVYGLGKGHFGNYARVPSAFACKVRPTDDLVHMATMPVVYMTAVYAFEHLTRLHQGQSVLIQSASGGVGLAAIQFARAKGAQVFAMAGSQEKLQFLVKTIGLPPANVFSAREKAEMNRAAAATRNGGFDVILSTAQGDMLHETAKALAPLGHLIDIGRADVEDARAIGLELFQKSASFSSFDLARVVDRDPKLGAELMTAVDAHYRAGRISPIQPLAISDISQLHQTLLAFSKGKHVGKLVVSFASNSLIRMVQAPPAVTFDPAACYIITGGLSGLGRSIIQWMGDRGARELVILSRRGGSAPEAQTLVDRLAESGIRVHPVACDLGIRESVAKAVEYASTIGELKGIVHCAVSYQDISFDKVTAPGWQDGLAAKVLGTRNLHDTTKHLPLEFFVMTTSILSVLSFATQAAYTAANNFQDQFARYRRRLGLPATAAQFGLVNDVGHLSTDTTTLDLMARNKVLTESESYFLRLLEPAFLPPSNVTAADPLAAATYVTYMDPAHMLAKERDDAEMGIRSVATPRWHGDARVSHVIRAFEDALRQEEGGADSPQKDTARSSTAQVRDAFGAAVQKARNAAPGSDQLACHAETLALVTSAISNAVATMLLLDPTTVNCARAVSDHGVDSLIAAELRNWFHVALGYKVGMVDLLDSRTSIAALAERIVHSV